MSAQQLDVRLATEPATLKAAQRLRYDVFVTELGGDGPLVDHDNKLERDRFDPFYDHLVLSDGARDNVVGVYRLLRSEKAADVGQFYSEDEYDLTPLKQSGRRLLELGRSCLHRDYRGGTGLYELWTGLARYVDEHSIDVLFGVASFHGTDVDTLKHPLSLLHHRHLAPDHLRARVLDEYFQPMDLLGNDQIDRKRAVVEMPQLIKAYLRLGGFVGQGAFIDHAFNTTDVFLVMDTGQMNERHRKLYRADRTS